jgi:single-strand DNA-binding protein
MANYNKVLLIGNLTRDPQLTYTPSQTAVVDFGLATNRRWTAQDGSQREETCFVDCRSFGKQAETINKYLTKGRSVFVEGRLTYDSWTTQDGSKRSRLRVTVETFQFMSQGSGGGGGGGDAPARSYGGNSQPASRPAPAPAAPDVSDDFGAMPQDEIPF